MPHCQNFKQKIEEIQSKADPLETLLLEYRNTGDEQIAQRFERELERILKEIEEFKQEYETKAKELLSKWYPKKDNLNEFLQNLKINEKGRAEIEELDLSFCGLSGHLYMPSLFEKIQRLDCFHNELTSLSELPDGLEKLYCFHNQLTSLPKLPDGLKILHCYGNQLTSLPKLPDGLKVLYCSANELTSLPKLPDRLEKLWCDNNQLTSLPELPKTLKDLDCSGCPLSEKTIRKIRSHPNYNPNWRI